VDLDGVPHLVGRLWGRVCKTFATRSILCGTDVTILQKILGHSEIGMTMRYVKIAEHYKVEAVVRLEKYRAVKMQEAVVKMQEQQEAEKMGMVQ
jgi:integrase